MAGVLAMSATADEPKTSAPQPVRTILERHDQSGVPGKEVVIGTATLPPGGVIGYHTHAGDEAGYLIRGRTGGRNRRLCMDHRQGVAARNAGALSLAAQG
jgi:quercetin dioxygenase-like cupin family protein